MAPSDRLVNEPLEHIILGVVLVPIKKTKVLTTERTGLSDQSSPNSPIPAFLSLIIGWMYGMASLIVRLVVLTRRPMYLFA